MKKFLIISLLAINMLFILACERKTTEPDNRVRKVPTPVFSVASGSYGAAQNVSISCTLTGAEIRYTLDGTIPDDSSMLYDSPLTINSTKTLNAIAFYPGYIQSDLMVANYTIYVVATPVFSPEEGTYSTDQTVSITCDTPGATICYTTDDTEPTASSAVYSAPIEISNATTLKARAFKVGWMNSQIATGTFLFNPATPEGFVKVLGGTFQMGSSDGQSNEEPVHSVTLSSFYIGKYEVTQSEWVRVMGTNPASCYGEGVNYPVYFVSWYAALVYCNKRSIQEGLTPCYIKWGSTNPDNWGSIPISDCIDWDIIICNWSADGYRLPTEAEWEYAARGGHKPKPYTYAGSNTVDDVAWYYDNSNYKTHQVGTKAPNELGIYDMSGNVWEWCWDWYGSYSSSAQTNPHGATSGSLRVSRGSSFYSNVNYCRVAYRSYDNPYRKNHSFGLRVLRKMP
jgi:formylglycine-generating enzyme required for sulfatase activity